ncbi:hypothetical protein QYF61_023251 [Mycteria americana]|uniref:Rna-directed dna polymerase from mobile element jockey-like n=1 Tax=Mycteria americana TaxID=33587 RepID=A0AAN7NFL3_MYCAM|nr:hypothetical protein QYF61_023251 [Mycteria americana]
MHRHLLLQGDASPPSILPASQRPALPAYPWGGLVADGFWPQEGGCLLQLQIYGCSRNTVPGALTLREVVVTPESGDAIQKDLNRLQKWTDRNLMDFIKSKYKVLHLG